MRSFPGLDAATTLYLQREHSLQDSISGQPCWLSRKSMRLPVKWLETTFRTSEVKNAAFRVSHIIKSIPSLSIVQDEPSRLIHPRKSRKPGSRLSCETTWRRIGSDR